MRSQNAAKSEQGPRRNIVRRRTGCLTCRKRKKRCDEKKPICDACARLDLPCAAPTTRLRFFADNMIVGPRTYLTVPDNFLEVEHEINRQSPRQSAKSLEKSPSNQNLRMTSNAPQSFTEPDVPQPTVEAENQLATRQPRLLNRPVSPDFRFVGSSVDHENSSIYADSSFEPVEHTLRPNSHPSSCCETVENGISSLMSAENNRNSVAEAGSYIERREPWFYATSERGFAASSLFIDGDETVQFTINRLTNNSNSSPQLHSYQERNSTEPWFHENSPHQPSDVDEQLTEFPLSSNWADGKEASNPSVQHVNESRVRSMYQQIYLRHWRQTLARILPPVFRKLHGEEIMSDALKSAINALSAAHLAHFQIEVRTGIGQRTSRCFYAPNSTHLRCARDFYNEALRQVAGPSLPRFYTSISTLATLLLFMYIERTIGSFRGEAFHENGVEKFLSLNFTRCSQTPVGRELIIVWLGLRAKSWSNRIPFFTSSFWITLEKTENNFANILRTGDAKNELILTNLIESNYLRSMMLLERLVGRGDLESVSTRCARDYHTMFRSENQARPPWRAEGIVPDEDYAHLLKLQSQALDSWHLDLSPSDLPIEAYGIVKFHNDSKLKAADSLAELPSFGYTALRFHSHIAAMNYAYYACARICQSTFLLKLWLDKNPTVSRSEDNLLEWIRLMIRILIGIDYSSCFEQNLFTLGVSEIISMTCLLLPPPLEPSHKDRFPEEVNKAAETLFVVAKQIMDDCASLGYFREAGSSVDISRAGLYFLLDMRTRQYHYPFQIYLGDPNYVWTARYNSNFAGEAIVYARDGSTGKFFRRKMTMKASEMVV